jgi:hypothetical protein
MISRAYPGSCFFADIVAMGCCEGRPQKPDAAPEDPVVGTAMRFAPRIASVQTAGNSFVLRISYVTIMCLVSPGHGGKATHCGSGGRGENEAHVWRCACLCR